MDLLYFVLLVGALVLVHELGHFAAARALGVKVLTFSLGFGPTLFSFRGRETTYRVALLPFGGFVRLLEDPRGSRRKDERAPESKPSSRRTSTSADELSDEDRLRTFQAQSLGRRALIALAGPTMNIVVPLFLFFAVFLDAGKVVPPVIGVVVAGSRAEGALHAGDRVLSIDGEAVSTYAEMQEKITKNPEKRLVFRVARVVDGAGQKSHEEAFEVAVTPRSVTETRDFGRTVTVGRIGVGPSPLAAVIGVRNAKSPAYRAGLRTFDVVTHVAGVPTPRFLDLEKKLRDNGGAAVPIDFLRPRSFPWPDGGAPFAELAVYEAHVAVLAPDPPSGGEGDGLARAGLENGDLYVASVDEGSSEWRAGLRSGDRVVALDGTPVDSWPSFVEDLLAGEGKTRELTWSRDGRTMTGLLRVRKEEWIDAGGQHVERYVFRSTHWTPTVPQPLVDDPHPVRDAIRDAFDETASVVRFLVTGAVRLVQGRLTVQAISGPLTIYDVAGRAGARGARDFLWVMALISINLGLLNLLPIPTLDGGQLLFLVIEALTRKPIPLRVREVMSIAGLSLLMLLMAVAIRNDVGKHWDLLMGPVRRLFG